VRPPSWVPALPPRLEPALAAPSGAVSWQPQRSRARWLGLGALLSALTAAWILATLGGPAAIERLLRDRSGAGASVLAQPVSAAAPPELLAPLPALELVDRDAAGSSIEHASFPSPSLPGEGSFFAYLPPGYASGAERYPVLYLLHGRNGHANAFLEIGIQQTLDKLIGARAIPPMIVVMVQDRPTLNNWRDIGAHHDETYVVEVQELADRMLRTIPARWARAVAGDSMGGFGAMNVALTNPLRFSVVESWLGYFNNLEGALHADAGVISRLGLHAFLYGAAEDPVAMPAEDPEFAAELSAEGAQTESAIYPGGHSLEKVQEHLETGLLFAGRSLEQAQQRAATEAAHLRAGAVAATRR
jgi:enterochelin esterase-like enzyme